MDQQQSYSTASTQLDYGLAERYFNTRLKSKRAAIPLFIIGGLLLYLSFVLGTRFISLYGHKGSSYGFVAFLAVICLVAGVVLIIVAIVKIKNISRENAEKISSPVTDQQYEAMINNYLEGLKENHALYVLGVDPSEVQEIKPLIFGGFKVASATKFKKGKDGFWRTNIYETVIVFFSASDIHCYTCLFDTISPLMQESTSVYFYRDIVTVATTIETEKIQNTDQPVQKFVITTTGGTTLSVSLTVKEDTERSVNAMRSLVRQKKNSLM